MAGQKHFSFVESPFVDHVEHVLENWRVPFPSKKRLGIPHHVMHRMCTDQAREVMCNKNLCFKYVALNKLGNGRQVSQMLDKVFSFCNEETWEESDRVSIKNAIIDLWLICGEGENNLRHVNNPGDWFLDPHQEHRAGQRPLTFEDHLVHYQLNQFPLENMMLWPKRLQSKFLDDRYLLAEKLAKLFRAGDQ